MLQHPRQRPRRFPRLAGRPMLVLIASGPQRPWRTMDLEWGVDKPQRQLHLGGSGKSLLGGLACLVPVPLFEPACEAVRHKRGSHLISLQVGTKLAITTSVLQQGRVTGLLETRIVNE